MLVSYNWLKTYFHDVLPSPDVVVDKLVTHAFEVEGLEAVDDDYIIDIDVLPNRGADALSHNGIARELAVILDTPASIPTPTVSFDRTIEHITVHTEENTLIRRVNKLVVADIVVGPSPKWLQTRLNVLGQQSINNIVDITNYVMFETGQPVHAFDYDVLAGDKTMMLRFAKDGEHITLLDEKAYTLDAQTLVWADSTQALDVAGIKGGKRSGVTDSTKRIVLSACNFDPVQIRKTRQRLKLATDASKRFEQGVTPERTELGILRTAELVTELAGGTVGELIDLYPTKTHVRRASATRHDINGLLGTKLTNTDITTILDRFKHAGFDWKQDGETYTIISPPDRTDVVAMHDVVEEIGRIYGYDNIVSVIPDTSDFKAHVYPHFYFIALLKKLLVREGCSEVYNYIMRDEGDVELANSLVEGKEFLRSSMVDSITDNLIHNSKYAELLGLSQIKLFEINKIVPKKKEHWTLGIGIKNAKGYKGLSAKEALDALIEKVDNALGKKGEWHVTEVSVPTKAEPDGTGFVAELDIEKAVVGLDVPDTYGDVLTTPKEKHQFEPISPYPFVLRDIAVWIPKGVKADKLLRVIEKEAGDLFVRSTLFDEFEKAEKVSYAYRLVFQSYDKTLTDEEVNLVMQKIQKAVADNGWEVR